MKLGDVLRKERERKRIALEDMASRLGISEEEYRRMEGGESEAEKWGPLLANIAICLGVPTARLLTESGKAADTKEGQAGKLIEGHRMKKEKSIEEMAEALKLDVEEYKAIEQGTSPIESFGPRFLRFAEAIDQPVFNLFYPGGLPLDLLKDYSF